MKKLLHHQIKRLAIPHPQSRTLTIRTFCTSSPSTFSLKNVTVSNFKATLPDLIRHIKAADFISVDLEMTGVTSAPWRESFEFDRHDVRYLKVKDSAEKFAVVQFGVCPFRWDPLKKSFIAHPHNFYIFPRQELPADGPSRQFLCQTTSIDFLAKYQFDFNACIRSGVSYLSREQEEEALSRLSIANNVDFTDADVEEVKDTTLVNIADILFAERMKIRFNEWRDKLLQERKGGSLTDVNQHFETIFFRMRPAILLKDFTARQLRLIELVTRKHFKDLVFVRAYHEDSMLQKIVVYVDSMNDRNVLLREVKEALCLEAEKKIKEGVGFRQVIDLLSSENKLIVGHNCFLDVAHIYSKFFGPLPSTVEEFVSRIHKLFPRIIDTKILLNANMVLQQLMKKNRTSLSSAFAVLCPELASAKTSNSAFLPCVKVEVQVDDMRSSNWNSGAKHEAGYDAFMTGCVFAQACNHLDIGFKSDSPTVDLATNEKLRRYINLLYLSWNSGDVINVSNGETGIQFASSNTLRKRLSKISHANVVLIWGFPSKLKAGNIKECLCKALGMTSVSSIYSLDETAVFVEFNKPDMVSDFLMLKEKLETSNDPISVLHPFSKLLEGGNTCAASYDIYKDICSSPVSKVLFAEQVEAVGIKWKTKLMKPQENVMTAGHAILGQNTSSKGSDRSKKADRERENLKTTASARRNTSSELEDLLYSSGNPPKEEMTGTSL